MSAFQSRLHQRIGGLASSSAQGRPMVESHETNHRSNENVTGGPQSGQPWAASSHMGLGASTSLTPSLSQGPSPAVFPKV